MPLVGETKDMWLARGWEVVDGARDPGLVPFSEMPLVQRTDYVFNASDSFWVPNAEFPLTLELRR